MLVFTLLLVWVLIYPVNSAELSRATHGVIRPCDLNDLQCIQDNLSANSKCSKNIRGSIPAEHTLYNFRFDTPYFNATYIDNFVTFRNYGACVVSDFFFNLDTDRALLALDCPMLDIEANRTLIQHVTMLEDTEYSYKIRGTYPLIRLTTNLPHANKIDICSSFTFAEVSALPIFKVDPNNKPTANFLSRDLTMLNIYEIETFFYRAPSLFRYFVNSVICDFGCDL